LKKQNILFTSKH